MGGTVEPAQPEQVAAFAIHHSSCCQAPDQDFRAGSDFV